MLLCAVPRVLARLHVTCLQEPVSILRCPVQAPCPGQEQGGKPVTSQAAGEKVAIKDNIFLNFNRDSTKSPRGCGSQFVRKKTGPQSYPRVRKSPKKVRLVLPCPLSVLVAQSMDGTKHSGCVMGSSIGDQPRAMQDCTALEEEASAWHFGPPEEACWIGPV